MSFGRIWQKFGRATEMAWVGCGCGGRDKKGLVGMWSTPQANFANEGNGIGSVRGQTKISHAARGHTCCSGLESHSLPLLGLVGCFICVSGSWFRRQIICTRFPNTFDTVSQRPQSHLPTSSPPRGNHPSYICSPYARPSQQRTVLLNWKIFTAFYILR